MPQNAKNFHRLDAPATKSMAPSVADGNSPLNGHRTEEENMAAVLKMGADQWVQQQEQMARCVKSYHRPAFANKFLKVLPPYIVVAQ